MWINDPQWTSCCNFHTNPLMLVLLNTVYFSGAVSCSVESMRHILSKEGVGNVLALIVGGAFESLEARPGSLMMNLSRRKGFVRLALEYGYVRSIFSGGVFSFSD